MPPTVQLKKKKQTKLQHKTFVILSITVTVSILTGWVAFVSRSVQRIDQNLEGNEILVERRSSNPIDRILHPDILEARRSHYGADEVWSDLIEHGKSIMLSSKKPLTVIEVGVHNSKQCVMAAKAKLHSHCLEPSPKSFERIRRQIMNDNDVYGNEEVMKHIHLYNVAAGDESGSSVEFSNNNGSTGDHVGAIDMYHMKINDTPENSSGERIGSIINVPTIKIDDVVLNQKLRPDSVDENGQKDDLQEIDDVFALKVDTQGFEPKVFAGMKQSIKQHKFQHILFEYWPKGMDIIGTLYSSNTNKQECDLSVELLDMLADAGYKFYTLPNMAHPRQTPSREANHMLKDRKNVPLNDFRSFCMYLRKELERRLPEVECKMGTWTDILAVAPGVRSYLGRAKLELQGSKTLN